MTTDRYKPTAPGAARRWGLALVVVLTLAALALHGQDPIALQSLRLAQFDQFQRWHPRGDVTAPVPVQVVDIDEASLKAVGQWPWPRSRLATLIDRLHAAGVRVVALDIVLSEADRTSPAAMAQLWQAPQVSALLEKLPDPDALLARSLESQPTVLGSHLLRGAASGTAATAHAAPPSSTPPPAPYRIVHSGEASPAPWLASFDLAVGPLPLLRASARGVGALNAAPDPDGVLRRVPLMVRVGPDLVPSLAGEALRLSQDTQNYLVRSHAAGLQEVRIGSITVPTNAQGEIWLHYPAHSAGRSISAAAVLDGSVDAALLRGHMVLVGSSAAGLMDLQTNPMGQKMPGVQAHALALEHMVSGQHLLRPTWAGALEAVFLALAALALGWLALLAPARWAVAALGATLALAWAGVWYAFVVGHLLLDATHASVTMVLVFGLASGIHHVLTERQQRWLRTAFSRYVSPNRVAHLLAHPEQLHLGGKRQVCSFIFTDLANFTPMLEASDPAQVETWLNRYLEAMLEIVFKHEGTLDRFVGDAMVVLFSAPVTQSDHRQRAMDCALEMDAFATTYASALRAQGIGWGLTRIGVHSGEVIVGNFGGKTLFDYRALGDPINTAARLESVNKHLGTRMCVSSAILDGCVGVPVRAVGRLVLKGKSQALQAFTPDAALDATACASAEDYAAAIKLLHTGLAPDARQALAQFEALALRFPQDPLVTLHLGRLRQGALDDVIVLADK